MTVAEMRQRISTHEFTRWVVYLNEKSRREEAAMKRANKRRRR